MFEISWGLGVLLHLGGALSAVMSMSKVADSLSVIRAARWTVLITLVPILGSLLWFWIGKPRVVRTAAEDSTHATQ